MSNRTIGLGLLAVSVFILFGLFPPIGGDLGMWLTVGRYTWEHGWPPMTDVFSFTSPGVEFIAHSWLAGVVLYALDVSLGFWGYALYRLTLVTTALLFVYKTAKLLGASTEGILLAAPFVIGIIWGRMEVRPHMFTSAILAFQLWLLVRVHVQHLDWRWLFTLAPLYALAINLHGGWIQTMIMLGLVGGAMCWGRTLRVFRLAVVFGLCSVALLLNPYGPRLLWFPFEMQADWIRAVGPEWQSPWGNRAWDEVGGGLIVSMEPVFFIYLLTLIGVILATVHRYRRTDLVSLAVVGFWLAMSFRYFRSVSDAVLMTAPFVAAVLPTLRAGPVIGIGLTVCLAVISIPDVIESKAWMPTGRMEPPCSFTAFERLNLKGKVFLGPPKDKFLYYFHPKATTTATWEYVAGERLWTILRSHNVKDLVYFVDRYQVDVVVLGYWPKGNTFAYVPSLLADGWVPVYADLKNVILVPRRPENTALIAREEYRWLIAEPKTPEELIDQQDEIYKILTNCPREANIRYVQ